MFSTSNQRLLILSIVLVILVLVLLYYENAATDFWQLGLPLEVAGFEIRSPAVFWCVMVGLSMLTALRAVIHHTAEREVDVVRADPQRERLTCCDVFWWVTWDVYERLMDTLTILIAVLRFDVWLGLFIVHVVTVATLHGSDVTMGRLPRAGANLYQVVGLRGYG